jgi:hypothetical protein
VLTCDRACIGCVSRLGSEHLTSPQPRLRGSRKSNAREGCCHVISLSPAQSARRHGPELRRQLHVLPRLAKACHSAAIELCPMRSSAASAALPAHGRCLLQSLCESAFPSMASTRCQASRIFRRLCGPRRLCPPAQSSPSRTCSLSLKRYSWTCPRVELFLIASIDCLSLIGLVNLNSYSDKKKSRDWNAHFSLLVLFKGKV